MPDSVTGVALQGEKKPGGRRVDQALLHQIA